MKPSHAFLLLPFVLLFGEPALGQTSALVDGVVVNAANDAPLLGARVKLDRDGQALYTKTDAQGRFQFPSLTPAQYTISVDLPGYLQPGESGRRVATPTRIDLRIPWDGGPPTGPDGVPHATVTVPLAAAGAIAVKLTEPTGSVCARCPVQLMQPRASSPAPAAATAAQSMTAMAVEITDDHGEVRFTRLLPGAYYLVAGQVRTGPTRDPSFRATYYPTGLVPETAQPVTVAGGDEARADIQLLSVPGVRVAGKLVPPDLSGGWHNLTDVVLMAQNYLRMVEGDPTATAATRFELRDVLPGNYTLLARSHADASPAIWGANQQIQVGANGLEGIEVKLQPLLDVPGDVSFGNGCRVVPVHINANIATPMTPVNINTDSAPSGPFALHGLTPGRVRLYTSFPQGFNGYPVDIKIFLADRELPDQSFDYPVPEGAALRIAVSCNVVRSR